MTILTLPVQEATATQRARYAAKIRKAQRSIGRLSDRKSKALERDLRTAKANVIAALMDATEFGVYHYGNVERAIGEALSQFRDTGTKTLSDTVNEAWGLGVEKVSSMADAAGVKLPAHTFEYGIPKETLEFAQGWAADLIKDEADAIKKSITKEIRLSMAGGVTREELISQVRKDLTKKLGAKSIKARARRIVLTETNRIHNAAAQATREKLGAENVVVKKRWFSSKKGPNRRRWNHDKIDGQTVAADGTFTLVGVDGRTYHPSYPVDPILPAAEAVNCGCSVIDVFEVIDGDADEIADQVKS